MKAIAERTVRELLIELDEEEAAELEGTDMEDRIVRTEGTNNAPRIWVEDKELLDLVGAVSPEQHNAFVDILKQLDENRKNKN